MATVISLLDLSDEILLEVVARIDWDHRTWAALPCVNHRFNTLMATNSLPLKAAQIQFPRFCQLLPPRYYDDGKSILLDYTGLANSAQKTLSRCAFHRSVPMDLVAPAVNLVCIINVYIQRLSTELTLTQGLGARLYRLWLMKLLPAEVPLLLRYVAWRSESDGFDIKIPTSITSVDRVRYGIFSVLERDFFKDPAFTARGLHASVDLTRRPTYNALHVSISQKLSRKRKSQVPDNGKCLPHTMQVIDAIERLRHTPFAIAYAHSILSQPITTTPTASDMPENGDDVDQQLKITTEFCERVEADGGKYGQELAHNLDLQAVGRILSDQASKISTMDQYGLQKSLAEEIQLLIG